MSKIRTVGFLGGMSYHSTLPYYNKINNHVQLRLGAPHTASLILRSFNYAGIIKLFSEEKWADIASTFILAGRDMKTSGAESLVIGCNIGHKVATELESGVGLPVLHIADATGAALRKQNITKVGLLGTKPVMKEGYIKDRLQSAARLSEIVVPSPEEWDRLNKIVFTELAAGPASAETTAWMNTVVEALQAQGAEAIVLACTDFQSVIKQENFSIPIIDSLEEHAKYVAEWSIDSGAH
ncbi:hypothetical protein NLG97_g1141 [Lecanicillium saksenae]|uniref:Uncharacterized protein n=1 Tax=Lecanicillium saksenae TaxID=468837 RepID=A0ACC1R8P1_9HYPO|nr:hypothetical protein NLG97_g1141 [Lecanicillium saksenae]